MPSSSRRMRSFSSGARDSRASRATCSTSSRVIRGSLMTSSRRASELLEVRVLERQPLAPDAGEVHRGDDVVALPGEPDEEPLAPPRVAELGAEPEREVVAGVGGL